MSSRMMAAAIGVVAMAGCPAAAAPLHGDAAVRSAIQAVLDASGAGWNAGDLDRFMACYQDAPTTSYVSGTRFTQGYRAIRAIYGERFAGGKAAMGELSLEILDLRMLDGNRVYVVGRYHLHRDAAAGGDAAGLTTLLFDRTPAGWRIIADHS